MCCQCNCHVMNIFFWSNLSGKCWPCSRMTALHVLPQRRAASVHFATPGECCAIVTETQTNKTSKESLSSAGSSQRKAGWDKTASKTLSCCWMLLAKTKQTYVYMLYTCQLHVNFEVYLSYNNTIKDCWNLRIELLYQDLAHLPAMLEEWYRSWDHWTARWQLWTIV